MVLSFPNHVEYQIVLEQVSATHAIVEVDPSPRAVEANVVRQCGHLGLSLEIARNLLLEMTNLVEKVAFKYVSLWMVSVASVGTYRYSMAQPKPHWIEWSSAFTCLTLTS